MSHSTDLRPLFAEYANGDISAERLQEIEAVLREDADVRREFIILLSHSAANDRPEYWRGQHGKDDCGSFRVARFFPLLPASCGLNG